MEEEVSEIKFGEQCEAAWESFLADLTEKLAPLEVPLVLHKYHKVIFEKGFYAGANAAMDKLGVPK
jgi:hypothetical protein